MGNVFEKEEKRRLPVQRKVNIAVVGDRTVGKTTLVHKYLYGKFNANYILTRGADYHNENIEIRGEEIHLKVVDTGGHSYQREIIRPLYEQADAIIMVYDVTNTTSYENIWTSWMKCIQEMGIDVSLVAIVANKTDLCRNEDAKKKLDLMINKISTEYGVRGYTTSAKQGTNIHRPFRRLIKEVLDRQAKKPKTSDKFTESNALVVYKPKKKRFCILL